MSWKSRLVTVVFLVANTFVATMNLADGKSAALIALNTVAALVLAYELVVSR